MLFVLLLIILFVDFGVDRKLDGKGGLYISYNTIEELEETSSIVVKGKMQKNEQVRKSGFKYTISDVTIDEIYKDSTTFALKTKDVIKVREPYYIEDKPLINGQTFFALEAYKEMEKAESYILFLNYDENSKDFYMNSFSFGIYPLDDKKEKEAKIDFPEEREQIKETVKDKYK